jgi:hypothetical protein
MTLQEEEDIIHQILEQMLNNLDRVSYLPDMLVLVGYADYRKYLAPILTRLKTDDLAIEPNPTGNSYVIRPTAKGLNIARHPGGYKVYSAEKTLIEQRENLAKIEKDKIEREAALATISANKAAWFSGAVAAVTIVVSLVSSFLFNNSLDKTNAQVEAQAKRIQALEVQLQHDQHPEAGKANKKAR